LHLHYINPLTVAELRGRQAIAGERQTIVNKTLLRQLPGLMKPEVEERYRDLTEQRAPIKIISGVRDPVDRSISLLFYFADFYGHKHARLSHRQGATSQFLRSYFIETWRAALAGEITQGTFDAWLQSEFVSYRDWFDTELAAVFDLRVSDFSFDDATGAMIGASGPFGLFCYRFEDLREPDATRRLLAAGSSFLETTIGDLPRANVTENRRSSTLYREFRESLRLPPELLDEIYSAPILVQFYRPSEIATMKARWS
jgi:hypothetical protein